MAIKLIKGTPSLKAAVSALENARGAKLIPYVQQLGSSLIEHMREHGDHTLLSRLANAIPGSVKKPESKRAQFIDWTARHTWLLYDVTEKRFTKVGDKLADLEVFSADPWYVERAKAEKPKVEATATDETEEQPKLFDMAEYIAEVDGNMRAVGATLADYQAMIAKLQVAADELLTLATLAKAA